MYLAGIVLYNPEIQRLKDNVNAIINQVERVLLVDNASNNSPIIDQLFASHEKIEIIYNNKNEGIAYALNQILDYAIKYDFNWFITLDQDSVAQQDIMQNYEKYVNKTNVAMITCEIEDRNMKSQKKLQEEKIKEVDRCITSGTLNNTKILYKIGGFDNNMFIDCVDFDVCQTIKENEYKIIKINKIGLLHEVGNGVIKKFLGKEIHIYNHNSLRVYYYVRNMIYYIKKHKKSIDIKKNICRLGKRILIILIFQKKKLRNMRAIIKGINDGVKMKVSDIDG